MTRRLATYAEVKAPKPQSTVSVVKKRNAKRQGARFPKNVNRPLQAFVRTFPCVIEGLINGDTGNRHVCWPPIAACHIEKRSQGARDDDNMFPGCVRAHQEQEGRTKLFERRYGIRLRAIARRITAQFYRESGRNHHRQKERHHASTG